MLLWINLFLEFLYGILLKNAPGIFKFSMDIFVLFAKEAY
jgi:hypothetical protein